MQPVCCGLLLLLPLGRVAAPACNLLPLARSLLCCCCLQLALFLHRSAGAVQSAVLMQPDAAAAVRRLALFACSLLLSLQLSLLLFASWRCYIL